MRASALVVLLGGCAGDPTGETATGGQTTGGSTTGAASTGPTDTGAGSTGMSEGADRKSVV